MKARIGTLAVLTAALACAPAHAAATTVTVRIEGATKTLVEGKVPTTVHEVTGDQSGPHKCDGTNAGAHSTPGPTATGALDDAARIAGLTWAGNFSGDDFLVNRIGPDASTSSKFWGFAVNGVSPSVGGCQYQVASGDEVLWAYDAFGPDGNFRPILHARAAKRVRRGRAVRVRVTETLNEFDAATGQTRTRLEPAVGAKIGGRRTNADGIARLRFRTLGVKRLKARRSGAIRSNQVRVKVLRRH
jgi:Domain of unknown function (DUF4430)